MDSNSYKVAKCVSCIHFSFTDNYCLMHLYKLSQIETGEGCYKYKEGRKKEPCEGGIEACLF